jgi:hypothetical protein
MDRTSGQHQFKLSQLRSISLKFRPQFAAVHRLCSKLINTEITKTGLLRALSTGSDNYQSAGLINSRHLKPNPYTSDVFQWPKVVCSVAKEKVERNTPETKCDKIPVQLCGPRSYICNSLRQKICHQLRFRQWINEHCTLQRHCTEKGRKYSQKGNCAALVLISIFIYL